MRRACAHGLAVARVCRHVSLCAGVCALVIPLGSQAQTPARAETVEDLKAQVLLRILMFVRWPDEQATGSRPLRVCIAGESALAKALLSLEGRSVNNHPMTIQRVRADQLGGCQVAYVAGADTATWTAPRGQPVLLIGDVQGALERGAMLNLRLDGTHVVFDVGLGSARAAGIEISAKVLRMARFVKED